MLLPSLMGALVLGSFQGCFLLEMFDKDPAKEATEAAETQLKNGAFPDASAAYSDAEQAHPTSIDAATGAAYMALLRGNTSEADAILERVEAGAGDRVGEVRLRRALVALEAGDLDKVRTFGMASEHPVGLLLAGEVALADGEREEAKALLERVDGGDAKSIANEYLALIDKDNPLEAGLSEAQALWALGERKIAVRSVADLLTNLPVDADERGAHLLLWAGRAASVRQISTARNMLSAISAVPEGQEWRRIATEAIVLCAEGQAQGCVRLLDGLEGTAPADGLVDARATAAFLVAKTNPDAARSLAGPYVSSGSARALVEAGSKKAARKRVPEGVFGKYLGMEE